MRTRTFQKYPPWLMTVSFVVAFLVILVAGWLAPLVAVSPASADASEPELASALAMAPLPVVRLPVWTVAATPTPGSVPIDDEIREEVCSKYTLDGPCSVYLEAGQLVAYIGQGMNVGMYSDSEGLVCMTIIWLPCGPPPYGSYGLEPKACDGPNDCRRVVVP